jgi:trans-aconitate 2-methyltransferase
MGDEWDAGSYQRVSEPQLAWGRLVVDRIPLDGHERAIDAGCGTGRVTRLLAERLPRGSVLAVDRSARMVEEATRQLADLGERVTVHRGDLLALEVDEPADLVLSTATFHWILDHGRLFARLHDALRPGGRLVAQCGGAGNIARTLDAAREVTSLEPYSEALSGMAESWLFAGPAETVERLEAAGFTAARAWLEEAPARFPDVDAGGEFLATVVLRHHLELLDEDLRPGFAREVAARCVPPGGGVEIDYVRLNIEARRPEDGSR